MILSLQNWNGYGRNGYYNNGYNGGYGSMGYNSYNRGMNGTSF